ncbi:MAG TPA: toxic anion resistance protein [Acidimicrobiia bacterium]|nr:toxic anion resistance protein [Acidimicrobiia bacterium]
MTTTPPTSPSPPTGAKPTAEQTLQPPAPQTELTLAAPQPVGVVEPTAASSMVPLDQSALPGLDEMVSEYVAGIAQLDEHSPEFAQKAESIRTMGDADIRAAANVSNRMLEAPVREMSKGSFSGGAHVSESLLELRRQIEDLDPSQASGVRKLLGLIPFGGKLREYFHRYESAQKHLNAILTALYKGQDELRKDNAALEQEKVHLWETMQRLAQYVYVAEHLDASLEAKIREIEPTDADRAKTLRQDVLFYVRQKRQDLLTQLAVSIQGYLAIDVIRKNNIELIKGVDRATTTTISALRTAVIVAQALANQKLVLDQITTLNTTTSNLIESTSKLLATQSVAINEQAASSTIGIDKLEAAFTNVYQAMDTIDTFKQQALSSMQTTIDTLTTQIQKAQTYLARARKADATGAGGPDGPGELQIPSDH